MNVAVEVNQEDLGIYKLILPGTTSCFMRHVSQSQSDISANAEQTGGESVCPSVFNPKQLLSGENWLNNAAGVERLNGVICA